MDFENFYNYFIKEYKEYDNELIEDLYKLITQKSNKKITKKYLQDIKIKNVDTIYLSNIKENIDIDDCDELEPELLKQFEKINEIINLYDDVETSLYNYKKKIEKEQENLKMKLKKDEIVELKRKVRDLEKTVKKLIKN